MAESSTRMRVVFVSYEFPPQFGGGIGTYVAAQSRILAQRGHRITVVTVGPDGFPSRQVQECGLEVVRLPAPRGWSGEPSSTLSYWHDWSRRVADYLLKLCRAEGDRIDAIEFPDYRGEALAFLSATEPGRRPATIVRLHTPLVVLNRYNRGRARHGVLEALENDAILMADHLVSPSAALAREVEALVPGAGKIHLLPYPADPAFLSLGGEPESTQSDGQSGEVLYVGRLEERKGVQALIAAAPRFFEACPGSTLHLVGGDTALGESEPSLKALLQRQIERWPATMQSRVIFHGRLPREEIVARYRRARLCVFPSLFENFPNVCMEAMSLGRPTIGTDNSGMAEMIEHGRSGLIARAGDAEDLAARLIDLWLRPQEERRAIGAAARQRMLEVYHPDVIAQRYESMYRGFSRRRENVCHGPVCHGLAGRGESMPTISAPPRVAVIIPCYNHGEFLDQALDSVRAQTWPNLETIIVDDGSTDAGTLRTLARLEGMPPPNVRVVRRANGGLAAARNTGVRATDAPFFLPLDCDDLIDPSFVQKLIAPLLADPTLGYAYSHVEYFGDAAGFWECPQYDPATLLVGNLSVATAVVRREAFDLAGGYGEDMRGGFEDWDFWLSLLSVGYRGACIPEPLFKYRKHASGSMLTETQRRRPELVRRMAEHHAWLYQANVEWAITEKDRMFFDAHMDSWRAQLQVEQLRQLIQSRPARAESNGVAVSVITHPAAHATSGGQAAVGGVGGAGGAEIVVKARAELEHILTSRAWRALQRAKSTPVYRMMARARWGQGWETRCRPPVDPCEHLACIKNSRSYRVIQGVKRTIVYRWYAERKYGPEVAESGRR